MEFSKASNCPSVAYQLTGFKKFQQILASPGNLEKYIILTTQDIIKMCHSNIHTYRYCDDPELVKAMRATFARQYSIDQVMENTQYLTHFIYFLIDY